METLTPIASFACEFFYGCPSINYRVLPCREGVYIIETRKSYEDGGGSMIIPGLLLTPTIYTMTGMTEWVEESVIVGEIGKIVKI